MSRPSRDGRRCQLVVDAIGADPIDVNHVGVLLRAIADDSPERIRVERDAQHDAIPQIERSVDERRCAMQFGERRVAERPALRFALRMRAKTQLVQPRAGANPHRKAARRHFCIERPVISGGDLIEAVAAIRDQPRENIESPGRAFRISGAEDSVSERQAFQKWHGVEATAFQHGAVAFHNVSRRSERGEELVDAAPLSRQKTGAHAIGLEAERRSRTGRLKSAHAPRARRTGI